MILMLGDANYGQKPGAGIRLRVSPDTMFDDPASTFAVLLSGIGWSLVVQIDWLAVCSALRCAILTMRAGMLAAVYTWAIDSVLADHTQDKVFRLFWLLFEFEFSPHRRNTCVKMAWCKIMQPFHLS